MFGVVLVIARFLKAKYNLFVWHWQHSFVKSVDFFIVIFIVDRDIYWYRDDSSFSWLKWEENPTVQSTNTTNALKPFDQNKIEVFLIVKLFYLLTYVSESLSVSRFWWHIALINFNRIYDRYLTPINKHLSSTSQICFLEWGHLYKIVLSKWTVTNFPQVQSPNHFGERRISLIILFRQLIERHWPQIEVRVLPKV